jgi:hypothetical protein
MNSEMQELIANAGMLLATQFLPHIGHLQRNPPPEISLGEPMGRRARS